MTGWRMGYAAGPKPVIEKISALVGQQISGIPGFIQTACLEALTGPVDDIIEMKNEFRTRRDAMLELMLAIPGLKCPVPDGAFYLFPDVSAYLGKRAAINTSAKLAKYLLDEARIATVSGDSFGSPENIRFSYATSMKNISEGMSRMSEALKKL
jgi:aspartate aminotransferase